MPTFTVPIRFYLVNYNGLYLNFQTNLNYEGSLQTSQLNGLYTAQFKMDLQLVGLFKLSVADLQLDLLLLCWHFMTMCIYILNSFNSNQY